MEPNLIEAGGNLGDCSLWSVSALGGTAVVFEPLVVNVERAERSKRLNSLTDNLRIVPAAVSDHAGRAAFYEISIGNPTAMVSSTPSSVHSAGNSRARIDVRVTSIDDELEELGWKASWPA